MGTSANTTVETTEEAPRRQRIFLFSRWKLVIFTTAVGALVGSQIYDPSKRVIEAMVGIIVVSLLWNFGSILILWIIIAMYPIPVAFSVGNSNMVFVSIIFVIYMIRVTQGKGRFYSDRLFNVPILLIALSYLFSLYNMDWTNNYIVRFGLVHMATFVGTVIFFYLIINIIDDERKLERSARVLYITIGIVITFTIIELLFPGRTIIPGWLYTTHRRSLIMRGLRMMGPFHDFELLAEFFAMNAPLILFGAVRSRRFAVRIFFVVLLIVDILMMFSTITRGAFLSLTVGTIYMAYICRKELNFVKLVSLGAAFAAVVIVLESMVARFTVSGSLFDRLIGVTFEYGVIPDTRAYAWTTNLQRALEHPLIGHGPGWNFVEKGFTQMVWPHSTFLYYWNITGLFGLGAFLMLLYGLFRTSRMGGAHALSTGPFPYAFMKVLNVSLVIFLMDMIKIDYLRNNIYTYFIWLFFGLIAATKRVILKMEREHPDLAEAGR